MTRRWDEGMVCGRNLSYAQVQVKLTHIIFCVANRQCGVEWSRRAKCNHQLHNQPGHDQRLELLAPQVFSIACSTTMLCLSSSSNTQIVATLPAGLAPGTFNLTLTNNAGSFIFALSTAQWTRVHSRTGWAGWSAGSCRPHWTRRTARATGHHRRSRSPRASRLQWHWLQLPQLL